MKTKCLEWGSFWRKDTELLIVSNKQQDEKRGDVKFNKNKKDMVFLIKEEIYNKIIRIITNTFLWHVCYTCNPALLHQKTKTSQYHYSSFPKWYEFYLENISPKNWRFFSGWVPNFPTFNTMQQHWKEEIISLFWCIGTCIA